MNDVNDNKPANITQGELSALMGQLGALSKQVAAIAEGKADVEGEGPKRRVRAVRERNVTVLFLDGKPVIGLEKVGTGSAATKIYQQRDPKNQDNILLMANPILLDPKTNQTTTIKGVVWPEFLVESEKKECRVVKARGEKWYIEQGTVMASEVKGDNYHPTETGVEVPVDIEGTEFHYIVDIDGKGVEIHEDYVNMAKASPEHEKVFVQTAGE